MAFRIVQMAPTTAHRRGSAGQTPFRTGHVEFRAENVDRPIVQPTFRAGKVARTSAQMPPTTVQLAIRRVQVGIPLVQMPIRSGQAAFQVAQVKRPAVQIDRQTVHMPTHMGKVMPTIVQAGFRGVQVNRRRVEGFVSRTRAIGRQRRVRRSKAHGSMFIVKERESSVRSALVAAQQFLDASATALADVNASGARRELDEAVKAFDEHVVSQGTHRIGSSAETKVQHDLRVRMRRQYLRPMANIAHARRGVVPALGSIRLPSAKLVGQALADEGKSIADAAEQHVDVFVAAGLKPGFLDGLRGMIQQLEGSLSGRTDHREKRGGATVALGSRAVNGRRVLRMLDGVIAQAVPDDAQLLAEWARVRRIPKKLGPTRGGGASEASGAPTSGAATAQTGGTAAA